MTAYYNENDPYAAQWLRNLIAAGHIPHGEVDDRSIVDVRADDLDGYDECHFFCGIGGWPLALALAGWRGPVWTGSCPCQPFSSAGRQSGSADDRHLWPAWFRLIRQCRPDTIFGEQVEGAVGFGWIDRVFADMEAEGYACGAAVLGAHSVSAPHIRQRLFWVAESASAGVRGETGSHAAPPGAGEGEARQWERVRADARADGGLLRSGLADAAGRGSLEPLVGQPGASIGARPGSGGSYGGLGDADDAGLEGQIRSLNVELHGAAGEVRPARAAGSPWDSAVWLACLDGKSRRVEPGIQPLAHGVPGRVGRLRAYGNAIVPQTAAAFVTAFMETA